jgi:hypothetical protein
VFDFVRPITNWLRQLISFLLLLKPTRDAALLCLTLGVAGIKDKKNVSYFDQLIKASFETSHQGLILVS